VKKFYKEATSRPVETGAAIFLDGRQLKSPAKRDLILPTEALAAQIAKEWGKQGEKILPETMPMMTLASTAVDLVVQDMGPKRAEIERYAETDLICYYADGPDELVARQRASWEPMQAWAAETLFAPLKTTSSIVHIAQAPETVAALRAELASLDHWQLSAMEELVSTTGSLVVSLAALKKHLTPEQMVEVTQIEENYQAERWGEDEEEKVARDQKSQDLT
jgi:chaperone required for assembly of F1-ATPase